MAEARYRGQKVVTVSPDYADNTKFADEWMSPHPGTDGALAMAMGHVILKEFFVERQVPRFVDYVQRYTDLPFLVTLEERDGAWVPDKFLTAADLGDDGRGRRLQDRAARQRAPAGRTCRTGRSASASPTRARASGTSTSRASTPRCRCTGATAAEDVEVLLPRFDIGRPTTRAAARTARRAGVPARDRDGERLVTTVFDLLLAQYGVGRDGPARPVADRLRRPGARTRPAWQEEITGVPAAQADADRPRVRRRTPRTPAAGR